MSDNPAGRVIAALESEPWLITQGAWDQLRAVAAREHDFEAAARHRGQNDRPLSFRHGADAVLDIRGALVRRASMFSDISGLSSTDALSDEFARLDADADVERIVIRLDTPGGQVSGLAEFAERIYQSSTPTVAYASDMAASAGYWLGSQADTVVVSPTAIVGSIGVRGRAPEPPEEGEMVSRYAPAKLGDRAASQAALDRLEEEFHIAIARGRGVDVSHVAQHYGQGGIFIGRDAVAAGLADSVSTYDQVLAGSLATTITRETRTHRQPELSMSQLEKDGSVSAAEHKAALDAALHDGHAAGKKEAEQATAAATEQAVAAERARVSAILKAGEKKPAPTVQFAIDKGLDAEAAAELFETVADTAITGGRLDAEMEGTNPRLAADAPDNHDDDEISDADAVALWK